MSLNPLEIALAFDSSILAQVNSNSRLSQIVRIVEPQKVIYCGDGQGKVNSEAKEEGRGGRGGGGGEMHHLQDEIG